MGRGAVLAEDFYSWSWIRMSRAYLREDYAAARQEEAWKQSVSSVLSAAGGKIVAALWMERRAVVWPLAKRTPGESGNGWWGIERYYAVHPDPMWPGNACAASFVTCGPQARQRSEPCTVPCQVA